MIASARVRNDIADRVGREQTGSFASPKAEPGLPVALGEDRHGTSARDVRGDGRRGFELLEMDRGARPRACATSSV